MILEGMFITCVMVKFILMRCDMNFFSGVYLHTYIFRNSLFICTRNKKALNFICEIYNEVPYRFELLVASFCPTIYGRDLIKGECAYMYIYMWA